MPRSLIPFAVALAALAAAVVAVPPEAQTDTKSKKAAPDAEAAASAARVEGGLKAEVWAAEPLLANPVSFAFDERGRCFVAETYRHSEGVTDTRGHMYWLDDDIACRSVADRVSLFIKHKYPAYENRSEQVRIVWDSTGSGHADKSDVFAGGFNRREDGLGAGVLARKGKVYYTCIPDLYEFTADKDKSVATGRKSLATGFGIHVQFIGHDMHGLRMGPDGKLYFTIGDRGFNVTTKEGKKLFNPDSGAVLRCDPDGANLEVVHVGLRNPQELAFDDFGNLFTFDNNSDSGDQARWVQVVEGGDSGWRCGYQYGTLMHTAAVPQGNRGPWNTEKIWHVPGPEGGPPAYVVPPLKHFGNGPSGMTHYPGVGLGDRYKDHFFCTDFTATPGNSKIWALAVRPKGASFEVTDLHPFVTNMVPTDCEFGPDGAFYWLDWLGGWDKTAKGRIFRAADPTAMKNPAIQEAQRLLAEGLGEKTVEELVKLLGHPHQQVRQEAQFVLGSRTTVDYTSKPARHPEFDALVKVAKESKGRLTRLHAIWALGMRRLGTRVEAPRKILGELAGDADVEVRVAVARNLRRFAMRGTVMGAEDAREECRRPLRKLMQDADGRVRAEAAVNYGWVGPPIDDITPGGEASYFGPLFDLLKSNDDKDPYVRHAVVVALERSHAGGRSDVYRVWQLAQPQHDTPAVRLGVVLALRRLQSPKLAEFLSDADPKVVIEAARAIHDQELTAPMADLAKLADKPGLQEAVAFRALNANFKLGTPDHAARLAQFAARSAEPDHLRAVALKLLADWAKPPRRDAITGLTQSLPDRPAKDAAAALRPVVKDVFAGSDAVRKEAVRTVTKLDMTDVGSLMAGLVTDDKQPAVTRAEALFALEALKAKELKAATAAALATKEPRVRAAGRVVAAKANPTAAATELPALLDDAKATAIEKQMALGVLGGLGESEPADKALAAWMDKLIAGTVPDVIRLDVLEAAQERANAKKRKLYAPLREKVQQYDQKVRAAAGANMALRFPEALAGGDAAKGRDIFFNNAAVYCQRCHKLDGQGGEVGPVLNGVAATKDRQYLLESLVVPNAQIAQGYQSVILNLLDGKTVSGVLRAKDKRQYTLVTPENKVLTIPADDVEAEKPDKSAMPDDLYKKLSKREMRDLVEFLASLKEPAKK